MPSWDRLLTTRMPLKPQFPLKNIAVPYYGRTTRCGEFIRFLTTRVWSSGPLKGREIPVR